MDSFEGKVIGEKSGAEGEGGGIKWFEPRRVSKKDANILWFRGIDVNWERLLDELFFLNLLLKTGLLIIYLQLR